MRISLQRRLARLERRAGINTGLPQVIVVSFVKPNVQFGDGQFGGGGPCEPARAEANVRVWRPEACQTRKQFEGRVTAEARKHNHDHLSATFIILYPAEEGDADFNPGTSSSGSDA